MGGHRAGEVASRSGRSKRSTAFIRRSAKDTDFTWPYGIDATLSFDGNRLRTAIHLANRQIVQAAQKSERVQRHGHHHRELAGQRRRSVAMGHVGDSRLYLLSRGSLKQLTRRRFVGGHRPGARPGHRPEQIAQHPMRNVLTNVLGAREQVDVHVSERPLGTATCCCSAATACTACWTLARFRSVLPARPTCRPRRSGSWTRRWSAAAATTSPRSSCASGADVKRRRTAALRFRMLVPVDPLETVSWYHDGTKHHFHAFARSLGYLDWASQPNPFRAYRGSRRSSRYIRQRKPAAMATLRCRFLTIAILQFLPHSQPVSAAQSAICSGMRLACRPGRAMGLAMVASRESLQRQPPPDRSVRDLRRR